MTEPTPTILSVGGERVLKLTCAGCSKGPSVEESPDCMKDVLEALIENPEVQSVALSDVYEREYRGEGFEALKEIAEILRDNRKWAFINLTPKECTRCETSRRSRLERIFEELSKDPASALRKLREFYHELFLKRKRGGRRCSACRSDFLDRVLTPLVTRLESCRLLKGGRRREHYAEVLQPLIRPCFLTSRLRLETPPGCELVDAYGVEGTEVRIYREVPRLQNLYFILPPEYNLPQNHVELMQSARKALLENPPELGPDHPQMKRQLERVVEDLMAELVVNGKLEISKERVKWLAKYLTRFTAGLGLIDILLADDRIQDIYVDAPAGRSPLHVYHRDYEECTTNIFLAQSDMESLVSKFRAISGRPFSEADPVLDMNLAGARFAVVGPPLSPSGAALAIRRHKPTPWTLPQFVAAKFLTPLAAGFLSLLVDANTSILITGSRGAGKTSLLVSLMLELLPQSRILTVEDTSEIPVEYLRRLGFKVQSLRVQSAVSGTDTELRAEDALKAALRLGESVLVIGEVRSSEARTLYEAMRVGMAGNSVMGTIHGATARDVFERVVHDLGVPPSSFKATDIITVAAPIRLRGGATRVRRLVQITEVGKGWRKDPVAEGGFSDLFRFDYSCDEIKSASSLKESKLIHRIAWRWATTPKDVLRNLELRAEIHKALVKAAKELQRPEVLEAEFVVKSNLAWRRAFERELDKRKVNYRRIYRSWRKWLKISVGR